MPFVPRIRDLDSKTNSYANLEMKKYVKYLSLMIDSNLSCKYHTVSICHKITKSIGIIDLKERKKDYIFLESSPTFTMH